MIARPHSAIAVLAAVTVLAAAWAVPAAAARSRARTTCAVRATLMSTPGGLVIGLLARGTRVIALRRTSNRYWTDVRAVPSVYGWIVGWIHTRDLC
jgi:hypothetical protein